MNLNTGLRLSSVKAKLPPKQGLFLLAKNKVPFSMAIRNWELVHECIPKHSRMGTVRMK